MRNPTSWSWPRGLCVVVVNALVGAGRAQEAAVEGESTEISGSIGFYICSDTENRVAIRFRNPRVHAL